MPTERRQINNVRGDTLQEMMPSPGHRQSDMISEAKRASKGDIILPIFCYSLLKFVPHLSKDCIHAQWLGLKIKLKKSVLSSIGDYIGSNYCILPE